MKYILIIPALALAACHTPETDFVSPTTGEEIHCGGKSLGWWLGGPIGYNIEKHHDERCVEKLQNEGYVMTKQNGKPVPPPAPNTVNNN